jgi:thymidylate kinase
LELGQVLREFTVVDASRPLETVTREVADVIAAFGRSRS